MNEKLLFDKYQKKLLALANNKFGRKFLNVDPHGEFVDKKILRITPNSVIFDKGKKVTHRFTTEPLFAHKLQLALKGAKLIGGVSAMELLKYFGIGGGFAYPLVGLSTITPGHISGGNGRVRGVVNSTWATVRDGTTGTLTGGYFVMCNFAAPNYDINRHFDPFDTSALGGAVPDAGFLRYIANGTAEVDTDNTNLIIVESTQASSSGLVVADYNNVVFVSWGTFDLGTWNQTDSATNDINLNSTGLAGVNTLGDTKLAVINSRDLDNAAPTGLNRCDMKAGTLLSLDYIPLSGFLAIL